MPVLSDSDGPARPSRAHVLACNTGARSQLASSPDRRRSSRDGVRSPGADRGWAGSRGSPCRQRRGGAAHVLSARSPGKHSPRMQQLLDRDSFQEAWRQYMGRARAAQAHAVLAASAATAAPGFDTASSGSGGAAAAGQQGRRGGASLRSDAIAGLKTRAAGAQQEAAGHGGPKGRHRKSSRGRHSAQDPAGKVHHIRLTACPRSARIMPSTACQTTGQAVHIGPGRGAGLLQQVLPPLLMHARHASDLQAALQQHTGVAPLQAAARRTGHVGRLTQQVVDLA